MSDASAANDEHMSDATPDTAAEPGVRVLQRVVFPTKGNLDVVALYVETKLDEGGDRKSVV